MKITPLEIRSQEFKRAVRGFDVAEVRTFLEMVADEFEALNRENLNLTERAGELNTKLEDYQHMERTLQETLMAAQKIATESKDNAQKEAELIIKDAEIKAEKLMSEARQEVMGMKKELLDLKSQKESFIARLKSLVNSQLELLRVLESEEQEAIDERETLAEGQEKEEELVKDPTPNEWDSG